MTELNLDWVQEDDKYWADTPYGKAVITELRSSLKDKWSINIVRYEGYIEQLNGTIVRVNRSIDNLEAAKWLLFERLQAIAQEYDTKAELADLVSTIQLCYQLLLSGNNEQHLERLKHIENIIRERYKSLTNDIQ